MIAVQVDAGEKAEGVVHLPNRSARISSARN